MRYSNPTSSCLYIHFAMMNFEEDVHVGIYSFNIIRMDNGTNYMNSLSLSCLLCAFFPFILSLGAHCKFLLLGKQFLYPFCHRFDNKVLSLRKSNCGRMGMLRSCINYTSTLIPSLSSFNRAQSHEHTHTHTCHPFQFTFFRFHSLIEFFFRSKLLHFSAALSLSPGLYFN